MLIAEIHGKRLPEAENHEDYLTSAVFGYLRFIAPGPFWQTLFDRAKDSSVNETPLTQVIPHPLGEYQRLQVWFWPRHPTYGEPDLLLRFSANNVPALLLLIEVKLESGKSGFDENDQLARYYKLLNDLDPTGIPAAFDDQRFLLYLTPRDSLAEIEQSLATAHNEIEMRHRVFRLQWQDVLVAADQIAKDSVEPAKTILEDVSCFLRRRNLEYFNGFHEDVEIAVGVDDGRFYSLHDTSTSKFLGMSESVTLELFPISHGAWVR